MTGIDQSTVAIAVAVVEHAGEFLIGPRPAGVPLAGYWEFPGGKVEPNESPAQAAVRECLEETGVSVEVRHALPGRLQHYVHGSVHLHFFHCRPLQVRATPRLPYRWVRRENLRAFRFPQGNQSILDHLQHCESTQSTDEASASFEPPAPRVGR